MHVFINTLGLQKRACIEEELAGAWLTANSKMGENSLTSLSSVPSHLKGRSHCAKTSFSKSTGRHVGPGPFPREINGRPFIDCS